MVAARSLWDRRALGRGSARGDVRIRLTGQGLRNFSARLATSAARKIKIDRAPRGPRKRRKVMNMRHWSRPWLTVMQVTFTGLALGGCTVCIDHIEGLALGTKAI